MRCLETLNFYPSENNHPSQFAVFEQIAEQNLLSLKQVRVRTLLGLKSLAIVDLRKVANLESLIINCVQESEIDLNSDDFEEFL